MVVYKELLPVFDTVAGRVMFNAKIGSRRIGHTRDAHGDVIQKLNSGSTWLDVRKVVKRTEPVPSSMRDCFILKRCIRRHHDDERFENWGFVRRSSPLS